MSEEKIQGTTMAGAANAGFFEARTDPTNAAPTPAAKRSIIEALAAQQGDADTIDTGTVTISLKKPMGSNYLRAIELCDGNANLTPFLEAMLCIIAINGDPHPTPRTKDQIYASADLIGRDGVDALMGWYQKKMMPELEVILEKYPNVTVGSPEFQRILEEMRAAKSKKS